MEVMLVLGEFGEPRSARSEKGVPAEPGPDHLALYHHRRARRLALSDIVAINGPSYRLRNLAPAAAAMP